MATQVEVGGHEFGADEPVDSGGTDTGPQPHELLLAALGACTSMTLRMYARRKGWPLENAEVRLVGGAKDGRYFISQSVRLDGPLDVDQRTRLMGIAGRCPVHRTLTGDVEITTIAANEQAAEERSPR